MDTRLPRLIIAATLAAPALALAAPIYSNDFESYNTTPEAEWSTSLRRDLGGPYSTFLGRFGNTSVGFSLHATETNTADLPDTNPGGDNDDSPFNITSRPVQGNRTRVPLPDQGGGGGGGTRPGNSTPPNGVTFDLGGALFDAGTGEPPSSEPRFVAGTYALTFDLMIFDSWDADNPGYGPDKFAVAVNGEKKFDELFSVHDFSSNFRFPDELPEQNAYNPTWQDQIFRDVSVQFSISEATDRLDFEFIGTLDQGITDESWGLDNVRVEYTGQLRGATAPVVPAPGSLALLTTGLAFGARRRR